MEPIDCVNPHIGGIGHLLTATEPTVALPHGMAQIAPLTAPGVRDRYLADTIYGFPAGPAVLMAAGEDRGAEAARYASRYDHDMETATSYHYSVLLEDSDITAEYTVSRHSAYYRFTQSAGDGCILHMRMPGEGVLHPGDPQELAGYARHEGVMCYAHMVFSEPYEVCVLYGDTYNGRLTGSDIAVSVRFHSSPVEVKIGISYIGIEQARANLDREIGDRDFERVKAEARDVWNEVLDRINIDGGTPEQRTVFYTALYRSLLNMRNITEDGRYYSGFDGAVHDAGGHDFYTVDNIWDSYRCLHPLRLLIEPERELDMVRSYIRMYEQSGWLAQFPYLNGDRPFMTGNHTAAMIADAYIKGYRDFDVEKAYEAMKKNAMEQTMLPWVLGPLNELDRAYQEKGFYPSLAPGEDEWVEAVDDFEKRQSVSVTLEHSYDDWAVARIAKALGKDDEYTYFMRRSRNYRNLYNNDTGFMSPKTADGEWVMDFDPMYGGGTGGRDYFTECNGWIYTFHVQHDIDGLIDLLGGKQALEDRLDALFAEQYGGKTKNEFLAQFPDSTGLIGQYCQGNEPAFHIPYLYNYAGAPWKTQRRVREIMEIWYNAGPCGICGDEDGGAMSAWYVCSAMGLYPVCPGKPVYDIGSPLFEKVRISLGEGKTFTIEAREVSARNKYIQSAELNGAPHNAPWIGHHDITAGGVLILHMGPRPNQEWGRQ